MAVCDHSGMPIRFPARSATSFTGPSAAMYQAEWRNTRETKTGIPVIGGFGCDTIEQYLAKESSETSHSQALAKR